MKTSYENKIIIEFFRKIMLKWVIWIFGLSGILITPFGLYRKNEVWLLTSICLFLAASFLNKEVQQ